MGARVKEQRVQAGGQQRTIRCDFNALCTAEETTGKSYMGGQTGQWRDIRALLYGSLVSGARATGEKVDFSIEDVGDWMQQTEGRDKSLAVVFLELWSDFRGNPEVDDMDGGPGSGENVEAATHDDPPAVQQQGA